MGNVQRVLRRVLVSLVLLLVVVGKPSLAAFLESLEDLKSSPDVVVVERADGTLHSTSLMFVENVGQFDPRVRFQLRSDDTILWVTDDALWISVFDHIATQVEHYPQDIPHPKAPSPTTFSTVSPILLTSSGVNVKISFPGANIHPQLEPFERQLTRISYFTGNDPAQWRADVPVWGGVRYRELYPGIDLEIRDAANGMALHLVMRAGAVPEQVSMRVEGAKTLEAKSGYLRLNTAVGELTWPLLTMDTCVTQNPVVEESTGAFEVHFPFTASTAETAQSMGTQVDNLLFSTFLGGAGEDRADTVALDAAGNFYVVGGTSSIEFPITPGAFDTTLSDKDAVIVKLNPTGAQLLYATFVGGSHVEHAYGIALDASNNAYVVGSTQSADFPVTAGAFDATFGGGQCKLGDVYPLPCPDAFALKLNATGTALVYATYLGGNDYDTPYATIVDGAGNAYTIGQTHSDNFPTTSSAFDTSYNGDAEYPGDGYWYGDAFITKLNSSGSGLVYSTYLGGSSYDSRWGDIALLPNEDVVVVGMTGSSDFPITAGAFDTTHNGGADAYVTRLNATGSALVYSAFIGGSEDEQACDMILDADGSAYVSGWTYSADFPTTGNAYQPACGGGYDGFVVKVALTGNTRLYATFLGGDQHDNVLDVNLGENDQVYLTGRTSTPSFPTTVMALDRTWNGDYDGFLAALDLSRVGPEQLVYATFLGGSADDHPFGVYPSGEQTALVVGSTHSADFPVTVGAYDTTFNGDRDGFVAKVFMPNPIPLIQNLNPDWYMVNSSGFTLTVNGAYFLPDSVVRWNGDDLPTYFVNGEQLQATIPSDNLLQAGYITTTVFTSGPGGGISNVAQFAIHQLAPIVSDIAPVWVPAGGSDFTLSVTGTNFVPDSAVRWNGVTHPTTFVDSTHLQAHISASDIVVAGEIPVTVFTRPPGGGSTEPVVFTITDAYEPDDTCAQAPFIASDGTMQARTFHQQADQDWAVFTAVSGTTYLIEVQVLDPSPADVELALYDACAALPLESQNYAFAPGVRMEYQALLDGPIYLKVINKDPTTFGPGVAYQLTVRALSGEATPGAVVIVAGRLRVDDPLQPNIHAAADAARHLFLAHGYDDERITYLATDATRVGFDGQPTLANLEAAITTWATSKVGSDRPFTLYLVDHGYYDQVYLDKPSGQWLEPQVLDAWLTQLETAAPGVKVNIIVEACFSGSFIDLAQTISKPGRVVMTSTGNWNVAYESTDGAIFSDYLLAALQDNESLYSAFHIARSATQIAHPVQTPWLDDNGNGVPNEAADGQEAQLRGFAYVGTLVGEQWPPYIAQAVGPDEITQGNGVLRATVLDDEQVRRVWAVIYAPTYRPPAPGEEMVLEALPTLVLLNQGGSEFAATYTGFDELGMYRVVIYAEDNGGREARPVVVAVRTGWGIYLPLVLRGN